MPSFQQKIITNRFTLLYASLLAAVAWLSVSGFQWPSLLGMVVAAAAVYLTAELNNGYALLRISSRMISTLLALLLGVQFFLQPIQAGHAVLICGVCTYFILFASYQQVHSPFLPFICSLLLGITSLLFPEMLFWTVVLWLSGMMLHSFTLRYVLASLMGLLLPYWFLTAYLYWNDSLSVLQEQLTALIQFSKPDYEQVTLYQWMSMAYVFLLFAIGTVDFLLTSTRDKTRTRAFYKVVMVQGVCSFLWLMLQPQHFNEITPLCLINTSILGGHYVALSNGKVQNIVTMVLFLIPLALWLFYLSDHLGLFPSFADLPLSHLLNL